MNDNKKPTSHPSVPPKPVFDNIRESVRPNTDHKTLDHGERKNETTVFRTRPVPDPGKK